jgi:N-acetylmuramoyl-L-alanine amidase
MRTARLAATAASAWLAVCAAASAATPHTVQPGETLWSIATANGMSPSAVAAANGISPDTHVVTGSTVQIPAAAPVGAGAASAAPAPLGAHIVLPGETLSGIAARAGVSLRELAAMNGVSPDGVLLAGAALKLPSGAPVAAPSPTPNRLTSSEIGSIAAADGVPPSLAAAIGWQESGFSNGVVSSANARGVMQVTPGTWQWVQQNLAASPLDPASSADNVKAGVLYLHQLLRDTGGDSAQAVAAYYQGLGSVRAHGMLPSTQRYVANVMALRSRFGGP